MENTPKDLLRLLKEETRSQGEDFPGHFLQARNSSFENFGAQRKQETFLEHSRKPDKQESSKRSNRQQARRPSRRLGEKENSADHAEISSKIKSAKESLTNSEPPPMTLETLILKRTLKSGSLKLMYILDTDEKPEKANIQGVEI